jgi:hypothetical protein
VSEPATGTGTPRGGWAPALIAIGTAVVYSLGWIEVPVVHTEYLALPISRELAFPGTYSPDDLIVSSGLRSPFHLYHAAQWLFRFGLDIDAWWLGAFIASLVALFASVWALARSIGLSTGAAAATTVLLAVARAQHLTVHDSPMPIWSFMSASVALPLAIVALALALRSRFAIAAAIAGAAFLMHPGLGVLALGAVGATALFAGERPDPRRAMRAAVIGALVSLPNVVYILSRSGGNVGGGADAELRRMYEAIAMHAFPAQYAPDGYGLVAAAIALTWLSAGALGEGTRPVRVAILWLVGAMLAYGIAVSLWPSPAIVQFYSMRAVWLLKPLSLAILIAGAMRWLAQSGRRDPLPWIAVALALVGLAHPNPLVTNGIAIAAVGMTGAARLPRGMLTVGAWALVALGFGTIALKFAAGSMVTAQGLIVAQNLILICLAITVLAVGPRAAELPVQSSAPSPTFALAATAVIVGTGILVSHPAGRGWLPQAPSAVMLRASSSVARGDAAALLRWVRDSTPPGSMIATPPFDARFVPLRHVTLRSGYVSSSDLEQLTYDAAAFREGVRRLRRLGVVEGPEPRTFDVAAYANMDEAMARNLATDRVSFAVVPVTAARRLAPALPVPFTDGPWGVVDLRPLGARGSPPAAGR